MKRCYYILIIFSTTVIVLLSFFSFGDNLFESSVGQNEIDKKPSCFSKNTSSSFKENYLSLYPNLLKCHLNYSFEWISNANKQPIFNDYTQSANETTHEYRINRAIIFYYPIEMSANFEPEFKWLYQSWIEMQKYEPDRWRTDLIFFINPKSGNNALELLQSYNCKFENKRVSREDRPLCRLIAYTPLKNRMMDKGLNKFYNIDLNPDSLSSNFYQHLFHKVNIFGNNSNELGEFYVHAKEKLSHYNYLDSILVAFEGYIQFNETYDLIMRSDMVRF